MEIFVLPDSLPYKKGTDSSLSLSLSLHQKFSPFAFLRTDC